MYAHKDQLIFDIINTVWASMILHCIIHSAIIWWTQPPCCQSRGAPRPPPPPPNSLLTWYALILTVGNHTEKRLIVNCTFDAYLSFIVGQSPHLVHAVFRVRQLPALCSVQARGSARWQPQSSDHRQSCGRRLQRLSSMPVVWCQDNTPANY